MCAEPMSRGRTGSASGFWKNALYEALARKPGLEIVVASPGRTCVISNDATATFRFPRGRDECRLPDVAVEDFKQIIEKTRPDLIHVHGTETTIGQVVEHTRLPVVVSLQGFISECQDAVLGGLPLATWKRFRSFRETITGGGFPGLHENWRRSASGEVRVLSVNRHFIGRTEFDFHVLRKHNSEARYYRGRELLRPVFFQAGWAHGSCVPRRIYCPGFSNPLKGFHILLDAVATLSSEFPDVQLCTPGLITPRSRNPVVGNGYHRFLADRIVRHGLASRVTFLGRLDGSGVQRELARAEVFVVPSLVENSSNALGEAFAVGCPAVIANPCGGLQSLVGSSGAAASFTQGDSRSLAIAIRTIFNDGTLAAELSATARNRAVELHGPAGVPEEYVAIYDEVARS